MMASFCRASVQFVGRFPVNVQHPGGGKRKRPSEDIDDMTRARPRTRKNAPSGDDSTKVLPRTRRRIKIEQPPYVCGNPQPGWVPQESIEFLVNGQPGIRLTDALNPAFPGLRGRDDEMFQYPGAGSSVSCRRHFPGCTAQSSQITTADHKKAHNPRTRQKVAFQVARFIRRDVEKLEIDIPYEDMILTKLVHVFKASWRPEIWYEKEDEEKEDDS